jgi:hypothetical protein
MKTNYSFPLIRTLCFGFCFFWVVCATSPAAVLGTGFLSVRNGGIDASQKWKGKNFQIFYLVEQKDVEITYTYIFRSPGLRMGDWILETAGNFTYENLRETPTGPHEDLTLRSEAIGSVRPWTRPVENGAVVESRSFWGLQFDGVDRRGIFQFVLVTDRLPMWGSFYADGIGGRHEQEWETESGFVHAHNSGLKNRQRGDFILVPGAQAVPEPRSLLLLGLAAAILMLRRRKTDF